MALARKTKKRLVIVLTLVVGAAALVGAGVLARNIQRSRTATRSHAQALDAIAANDYMTAVKRLTHYVRTNPTDGEAWLLLSDCHEKFPLANDRHLILALKCAQEAGAAMPADPRPLARQVAMYRRLGFPTDLLLVGARALEIDPKNRDVLSAMIDALVNLRRTDEALTYVERLLGAYPDDEAGHEAMVELMLRSKRPTAEVRKYVDEVATRLPNSVEIAMLQVRGHVVDGDIEGGRAAAIRATQIGSKDPETLARLLKQLDLLGMDKEATDFLARSSEGEAGRLVISAAAERAWTGGDTSSVLPQLTAISGAPAGATDAAIGWAALLLDRSGPEAPGAGAMAELAKRTTSDAKAWQGVIAGWDAIQRQDFAAARSSLEEAAALAPNLRPAHALLGEAEARLGETAQAMARWRRLLTENPRWLPVRLSLVAALLGEGRLEEASTEAREALGHWPTRYAAAIAVARTGVALAEAGRAEPGDTEKIIAMLEAIEKSDKPTGDTVALLARALAAEDRTDDAQARVERIIRAEVQVPAGDLMALADVWRRRALPGADELRAMSVGASGNDPAVVFAAALAAAQAGRADEGAAMLREAAAKSTGPGAKEMNRRLAIYLDMQGDPSGLTMLKEAASRNERDPGAQSDLLNSANAWTDETVVAPAITRLKAAMGDRSTRWRIYEARRLLTFSPTPAKAASVVQPELLGDLIREDTANVPALTLAADAMLRVEPPSRDKAIEYLTRAAAASDQAALSLRLAALLQEQGRSDESASRLRAIVGRTDLTEDQRRLRADLLFRQAMWPEAEADLAALAQSGGALDLARLGAVKSRRGDAAGAKAAFDRVAGAENADPEALALAADFYGTTGEIERGAALLARIPEEGGSGARMGAYYERLGRYDEAEKAFTQRAAAGTGARPWGDLAGFLLRRERADDARAAIERGLAIAPADPDLKQIGAMIAIAGGAPVKGLETGPTDGPIGMLLDAERIRTNAKDLNGYIERLAEIRDAHPTFFPAWRRLVAARFESGDPSGAANEAMRAASAIPGNPEAAEMAVEALTRAERNEEAMGMAREWRNRTLNDPLRAEVVIARLEAEAGRPQAAIALLDRWKDRLVAEGDSRPEALAFYATALASVGREQEAAALIEPKAKVDPRWALTFVNIARSMLDRPEAAAAWIERSKPLVAGDPRGRLALAQAMWDLALTRNPPGPFDPIIEALSGLDADKTVRGPASVLMAAANEQKGDLAEAERLYRVAIAEMPDAPLPLNNLAYLLIKSDGDSSEAAALAGAALEAAQKRGMSQADQRSYLDTLGLAQLRAKRYEEAAKSFARGLETNPSDRNMLLGQAEAYARLGRLDDAKVVLRRLDAVSGGEPLHPDYAPRLAWLRSELGAK